MLGPSGEPFLTFALVYPSLPNPIVPRGLPRGPPRGPRPSSLHRRSCSLSLQSACVPSRQHSSSLSSNGAAPALVAKSMTPTLGAVGPIYKLLTGRHSANISPLLAGCPPATSHALLVVTAKSNPRALSRLRSFPDTVPKRPKIQ